MTMYRVEQDAPRGADYAEAFFEVFAKNKHEAWKKAIKVADYKILKLWAVKTIY